MVSLVKGNYLFLAADSGGQFECFSSSLSLFNFVCFFTVTAIGEVIILVDVNEQTLPQKPHFELTMGEEFF